MTIITKVISNAAASVALAIVGSAASAEKWDMPMAYASSNFHSEMGVVFADKVRDYTSGDIDITVHPGGSLFKGGEIKRAVQTGQAPIGERFMSAHANEAPLLGWDNLPFIATTYEQNNSLWDAAKDKVNAQILILTLWRFIPAHGRVRAFISKKLCPLQKIHRASNSAHIIPQRQPLQKNWA